MTYGTIFQHRALQFTELIRNCEEAGFPKVTMTFLLDTNAVSSIPFPRVDKKIRALYDIFCLPQTKLEEGSDTVTFGAQAINQVKTHSLINTIRDLVY